MKASVKISVEKMEGSGVNPSRLLDGLVALKHELQGLGAEVSITIGGFEVDEILPMDTPKEVKDAKDSE